MATIQEIIRRDRARNGEYPYYMDEYHAFSELFRMLLDFLASLFSGNTPPGGLVDAVAAAPQVARTAAPTAAVPTRFEATPVPTATVANTLPVVGATVTPPYTPTKPSI
ncbi:MAG: hypothetical protein AB7I18_13145 [Candidatus Berkiella sp.]